MRNLLENLTIEKAIVQPALLAREIERLSQRYERQLISVDDNEVAEIIARRLVACLRSDTSAVEVDVAESGTDSPFYLCANLLQNNSQIVSHSQLLAEKLTRAQALGGIKAGVLLVLTGKTSAQRKPFCALIKADASMALEFTPAENEAENSKLSVIKDLFLTPDKHLMKVGFFVSKTSSIINASKNDFNVYIFDEQMAKGRTGVAAAYFYSGFLRCDIAASSKKQTRTFFEETNRFIKNLNLSTEDKVNMSTALYSYLRDEASRNVSVQQFADSFLGANRANYLSAMDAAGVKRTFSKDNSMIKRKLIRRVMRFGEGISLSVPSSDFQSNVLVNPPSERLEELRNQADWTIMGIKGRLSE